MLAPARLRRAAFVAGCVASAWMVTRAQVGGDQLHLLIRGWLLAARHTLIPYGNPLSSGGMGPGVATTLLVGGPLALWRDHHAPIVLVWVSHLAAYLLLDRRLRSILSPWERTAFTMLYWLGPWRLEASAFLWNPNFLFLAGALHFATALDLRARPAVVASAVHVLVLAMAVQLHPAAVILVVASLALWSRGHLRLHWGGVTAGALLGALFFVPWLVAVAASPAIATETEGFPLRGLLLAAPLLKGLLLWPRYASLWLGRRSALFDFTPAFGEAADAWLTPIVTALHLFLGVATMGCAVWAFVWWLRARWRGGWASLWPKGRPDEPARAWVGSYVLFCLFGSVVAFAITPTTPQSWQGLALLHAAILPPVFWIGRLAAEERARKWAVRGLAAFGVSALLLDGALALAGPRFRCGGRERVTYPLRSTSAMFEELGIQRTCPWPLNVPGGAWPDLLPEE